MYNKKEILISDGAFEFLKSLGTVYRKHYGGEADDVACTYLDSILTEFILGRTKRILSKSEYENLWNLAQALDSQDFFTKAIEIMSSKPIEFDEGEPLNPQWTSPEEILYLLEQNKRIKDNEQRELC